VLILLGMGVTVAAAWKLATLHWQRLQQWQLDCDAMDSRVEASEVRFRRFYRPNPDAIKTLDHWLLDREHGVVIYNAAVKPNTDSVWGWFGLNTAFMVGSYMAANLVGSGALVSLTDSWDDTAGDWIIGAVALITLPVIVHIFRREGAKAEADLRARLDPISRLLDHLDAEEPP